MRVVVGVYSTNGREPKDATKTVEFEGVLLATASRRTGNGGVRQRLFRTADGRLIVSQADWTLEPLETTYTLHQVRPSDLAPGGRFAKLGAKADLRSEPLTLDAALKLDAGG